MSCPYCNDRGIVFDGEQAVRCSCMRDRAWLKKLASAHLSPLMRQYTFERFDLRYYSPSTTGPVKGRSLREAAQIALHAAQEFAQAFLAGRATEGLLISGQVGSGKTFLACAIANAVLAGGGEVLFLVVPDFLDRLRATYDGRDEVTETELIEAAKQVPLLILDDLGAHQYTDWARQKIYSILNHRLNHLLPVVVTTNLDLDQLAEQLGQRTVSRLCQLCRSFYLEADEDIRIIRRRERDAAQR